MILYVNACVRKESRTEKVAARVLAAFDGPVQEVVLGKLSFPRTDEAFLLSRDQLIKSGQRDAPMFTLANQFAEADRIVIAAPYWDLSFPAALKQYIEQINVTGITFRYTDQGLPEGLCRAEELIYITTAGGAYVPDEYGYGYIKALAENFYGIPKVRLIIAKGLDIEGADEKKILSDCLERIGES